MDFDLSKIEGFDWNKGNLEHIKKHNVDYRECEQVFFNKPIIVNEDERHSKLEERFQALGQANNGRLLFIAFTIRENKIRIISSRDQNRKEKTRLPKRGGGNK
ncbi:MAG: hypothetical protein UR81_C0004G0013 [Candidatus Levybacteria bacterium GW2011_GWB1_35_5]|nr:MAG: hypothetical protein UR81_C0004G0013 [Candidatus Levybacteria bacterium GW2011_GWB1_35_5]